MVLLDPNVSLENRQFCLVTKPSMGKWPHLWFICSQLEIHQYQSWRNISFANSFCVARRTVMDYWCWILKCCLAFFACWILLFFIILQLLAWISSNNCRNSSHTCRSKSPSLPRAFLHNCKVHMPKFIFDKFTLILSEIVAFLIARIVTRLTHYEKQLLLWHDRIAYFW